MNVEGFEKLVLPELRLNRGTELFIVDEIGKMECLSDLFCRNMYDIFASDYPLIATIASGSLPITQALKSRSDVVFIQVNQHNRESIWKNVLVELG